MKVLKLTGDFIEFLKRESAFVMDCYEQIDKAMASGADKANLPEVVFDNDPAAIKRFFDAQRNFPQVVSILAGIVEAVIDMETAPEPDRLKPEPDRLKPEPLTREEIDQIKMAGGFGFHVGPVSKSKH